MMVNVVLCRWRIFFFWLCIHFFMFKCLKLLSLCVEWCVGKIAFFLWVYVLQNCITISVGVLYEGPLILLVFLSR